MKDFTHVALFGGPPAVLAVNPTLPAKDLSEFVALAKAKPGTLSYGSPGNGTQGQLVAELFKHHAGIDMQHVPYKGASGAVTDLIAGHIQVVSTTLSTAASQIRAGTRARARAQLRGAAAGLSGRADVRRDRAIPTSSPRSGSRSPGPPAARRHRAALNAEVRRALDAPDVRERLRHEGIAPNRLDARSSPPSSPTSCAAGAPSCASPAPRTTSSGTEP